ncbi:hypothetical protein KIN20_028410 [Parelaphostrongylus tenuis]|uniref:Uncharacterized protein n=1 Tax=Parelaphostrongylus tenuis TaxID=148309 RepID=A0AAD5R178_PARTN|nr:hypothetical protein KIN20_028410 [Parelaphostrongylus tenuis]
MRESGYPGPFRLPECVAAVKKRRDMVSISFGYEFEHYSLKTSDLVEICDVRDMPLQIPLPGEEEVGSELVLVSSLLDWSNEVIEFVNAGENEQELQQHDHPCKAATHDSGEINILHGKEPVIISSETTRTAPLMLLTRREVVNPFEGDEGQCDPQLGAQFGRAKKGGACSNANSG